MLSSLCFRRCVSTDFCRTLGRVGVEERCPPRQESRVERLKAKVEPMLTEARVDPPEPCTLKAKPQTLNVEPATRNLAPDRLTGSHL